MRPVCPRVGCGCPARRLQRYRAALPDGGGQRNLGRDDFSTGGDDVFPIVTEILQAIEDIEAYEAVC